MTHADLELCIDLGLAEPVREGVYVLTGAGRILAGLPPPQPRPESLSAWLARVDAARGRQERA